MTDTPDLRSSIVVWAIWALTLTSLLAFIVHDGRNIPFEEDWMMVAPMTGHEPHLASWLWSQNSEHRLPLPRLVNLALLRATGDFRATMLFDALILAAVTAGMILHARRLRGGRTRLEDVFFPLLLLHLGNWDNLVWAWQIQYVLPTVLTCVILLTIVGQSSAAVSSGTLIGALALVCLPLSGANGLIVTPPLAAWFAYQAWAGKDGPRLANRRWVPASAAVLSLVLCAVYFVGFDSSPWNAASPGPTTALATFGKFVALGLGPLADYSWPLFGVLAAGTLVCAGAALLWALPRRDEDRIRLVGLLAFLAAALVLAALVGWGRAGRAAETGRMPTRYVLLAAPGMCAAYFAILLYAPRRWRSFGPAALALLVTLAFPLNTHLGLKRRAWFGEGFASFERDQAAGASAQELARRHHEFMLHWDEQMMVEGLRRLHEADIGPFAAWEPDP
jgi:hypothetical protein